MLNETPEAAHPTKRRNTAKKAGVVAVLVAVVVMALAACSPEEDRGKDLVNQSRSSVGLAQVGTNVDLYFKALNWSRKLANDQALSHSSLPDGNGYRWCRLGENVGYGYSMDQVHQAFHSGQHVTTPQRARVNRTQCASAAWCEATRADSCRAGVDGTFGSVSTGRSSFRRWCSVHQISRIVAVGPTRKRA